jgi:hypothetical protein
MYTRIWARKGSGPKRHRRGLRFLDKQTSAMMRGGSPNHPAHLGPCANCLESMSDGKEAQQVRKRSIAATRNAELAQTLWGNLPEITAEVLQVLTEQYFLRIALGDLILLDGKWYVTHSGLLGIARRKRCHGICVEPLLKFCDAPTAHWAFKATVFRSATCKGFVGFGDADPSNVSPIVHGAEMRIAETRAVNRALRKAYGIGICSVEELGGSARSNISVVQAKKPAQPVNGNYGEPKVRDRLCQLIRQHQLDPNLVKAYAIDFCGTKTLREATRAQVENFVAHLGDRAEKDRNALLCQLNSYLPRKEGAA